MAHAQSQVLLGVGVGGEYPKEFEAVGVPVNERGARTDEAITVMKRLYTEDNVSFDGRFTKFTGVTLQPKPTQSGGPPIWIPGRSEAAIRRAGRCALSALACTILLTSLWGARIL